MKWLEEMIDRVNAGGISGEWATQSQVAASSAVDKLESPAIPDDTVVDLVGCLIDEVVRLREEIIDGDYWHKRVTQAIENGTCPICFSGDESGHKDGCLWGEVENRADQLEAEIERLRGDAASLAVAREQLLVQADEIKRLLRSHYEIERLRAIIAAKLHRRKCHDCGQLEWTSKDMGKVHTCDECYRKFVERVKEVKE